MSLLEDIYLRDEADEAKELERIIEGDDYNEKPELRSDSDDNSEKEDEAEEEKKRVDPSSTKTKRAVKNPRFILNPARLTGPRGIQVIPDHFKDFKFKGKGHEKEDLDLVLKKLEHWAYRLYPKFKFEDCLKKIETLGKKRPVMVHLHKIRSDQYISEEAVVQKDSSDDENAPVEREEDEFDKLLQQQIDLARSTPGPGSVKKHPMDSSVIDRSFTAPKAISSPSISEEQRERMMRSRKLAEERRLARLKNNSTVSVNSTLNIKENNITTDTNTESSVENVHEQTNEAHTIVNIDTDDITQTKKHNRTNVIESSEDEDGVMSVNEPITVDVHTNINNDFENSDNNAIKSNEKTIADFDSIINDVNAKADVIEINKNEDIVGLNVDKPNQESDFLKNTSYCYTNTESVNQEQSNDSFDQVDNVETNIVTTNISDKEEINQIQGKSDSYQNKMEIIAINLDQDSKSIEEGMSCIEESETIEINKNVVEITEEAVKEFEIKESAIVTNVNEEIKLNEDISKDLDDDLMDVDFSEDF